MCDATRLDAAGCVCVCAMFALVLQFSFSFCFYFSLGCAYLPANYRKLRECLAKIYGLPAAAYIIESDVY